MSSNGNLPQITRGFGTFHSSNIESQLQNAETEDYVAPELPVHIETFECYKCTPPVFGNAIKEKHFYLEKKWTFVNHGAFGAALREAVDACGRMQIHVEQQPVRWIDRQLFPQIVFAQKRLAEFVGCKASDIVLVQNATTGTNSVLNSLKLDDSSLIYHLNTIYGAVKKSLAHVCGRTGAKVQAEDLPLPVTGKQAVVDLVDRTLKPGTTLALFDHVPSHFGFVLPVEELVQLCHSRNVPVMIDGAHAMGAIELNLPALGADYYVSNCHKWMCATKGCGFLYVKRELQSAINGPNVSHGYGSGFQSEFSYVGLKDYTPYVALHASLNFWKMVGPEVIRAHMRQLLHQAAGLMVKKWKSFLIAPPDMHERKKRATAASPLESPSLLGDPVPDNWHPARLDKLKSYLASNASLASRTEEIKFASLTPINKSAVHMIPVALPPIFYATRQVTYSDAELIQNRLFAEHAIEAPVKCAAGKLFVRISAHVYNQLADYDKLADAVLSMAAEFDAVEQVQT